MPWSWAYPTTGQPSDATPLEGFLMARRSARRKGKGALSAVVNSGPWRGVKDVGDAGSQHPAFLQDAINAVFVDPQNGGAVEGRHGFAKATSTTGLGDVITGLHSIVLSTGTAYLFAFSEDGIFRQDPTFGTWTDVTPASGFSASSSRPTYAVTYGDAMVLTTSTGGPILATDLTADPITVANIELLTAGTDWFTRGRPTVYGGKVFFIVESVFGVASYSSRIVWSEEGDATLGYMQDGFTNVWDLSQTSNDDARINGIIGTNTALYYFRSHSIGAIYGAVNDDFTTASTHDAVSQEIGGGRIGSNGASGIAPIVAAGYVWFHDNNGYPHRFRIGSSTIEPIWMQMRNRIEMWGQMLSSHRYHVAYIHQYNKVAFTFIDDRDNGGLHPRSLDIFDAVTGSYEGRWIIGLASQTNKDSGATGVQITAIGEDWSDTISASGFARFVVAGSVPGTDGTPGANDTGHVYRLNTILGDGYGDMAAAMHMSITTHTVPVEQNVEFNVDEVAIETVPDTTAVSLDYYTPYGSSTGLSATGAASADSIQTSHDHGIARFGLGPNAFGRWFRAVFHKNVASGSTRHAFERASYKIRVSSASPFGP